MHNSRDSTSMALASDTALEMRIGRQNLTWWIAKLRCNKVDCSYLYNMINCCWRQGRGAEDDVDHELCHHIMWSNPETENEWTNEWTLESSHFQKIHPKGSLVCFQGITMVYLLQKTCVCRPENLCRPQSFNVRHRKALIWLYSIQPSSKRFNPGYFSWYC